MTINWNRLAELEDGEHGWRSAFPELSPIFVAGEGDNPIAMLIGEAPGAQEESRGRPFVGESGKVLRGLMELAGLYTNYNISETIEPNCWITNVVKFRPPRNRTPKPLEIQAARPCLRREWICIGRPSLIVPIGGTALQAVMGKKLSILKFGGQAYGKLSKDGKPMWIFPQVHPRFGISQPAVRPLLEKDWQKLGEFIDDKGFRAH